MSYDLILFAKNCKPLTAKSFKKQFKSFNVKDIIFDEDKKITSFEIIPSKDNLSEGIVFDLQEYGGYATGCFPEEIESFDSIVCKVASELNMVVEDPQSGKFILPTGELVDENPYVKKVSKKRICYRLYSSDGKPIRLKTTYFKDTIVENFPYIHVLQKNGFVDYFSIRSDKEKFLVEPSDKRADDCFQYTVEFKRSKDQTFFENETEIDSKNIDPFMNMCNYLAERFNWIVKVEK